MQAIDPQKLNPPVFVNGDVVLPCYISVEHTEKRYGGPEEGGWWYNASERVETHMVHTLQTFIRVMNRVARCYKNDNIPLSSVLSRGKYSVYVMHDVLPKNEPAVRPHYE
jgi:hypothetical protein